MDKNRRKIIKMWVQESTGGIGTHEDLKSLYKLLTDINQIAIPYMLSQLEDVLGVTLEKKAEAIWQKIIREQTIFQDTEIWDIIWKHCQPDEALADAVHRHYTESLNKFVNRKINLHGDD